MRENRAEHRRFLIARVEVRWEDKTGTPIIDSALVEDASSGGAGIQLDKPSRWEQT